MDSQALVTQLRQLNLWPDNPATQEEIVRLQQQWPDGRQLGRELLQRNVLTAYQANQLLTGKGHTLAVGPYRILERLGEGGMCQVFKARHTRLDRLVALKVIRETLLLNPQTIERFLREMEAVARLSHPNVVLAFDADQAPQGYYITMQFLDGITLSDLVKRDGPLPVEQACSYAVQCALGLQHIHQHRLVHRDLKPANLLVLSPNASRSNHDLSSSPLLPESLRQWGQIKILDLGLARLVQDAEAAAEQTGLTRLGTVMGTADYMAPEQALQSSRADIRSDVYSLGCTLYYALTGRPPFPGGNPMEKMLRHQLEEPTPVDQFRADVPVHVCAVMQRMMAKKPEHRYPTPVEAAAALQDAVDGRGPASDTLPPAVTVAEAPPTPVSALPAADQGFDFDDTESGALLASRVASLRVGHSEWGLWILLACVGAGGLVCLIAALMIMLR